MVAEQGEPNTLRNEGPEVDSVGLNAIRMAVDPASCTTEDSWIKSQPPDLNDL
jgi:hypothetical protein